MAIHQEPPLRPVSWTETLEDIIQHRLGAPLPGLITDPRPQVPFGIIEIAPDVAIAVATSMFRVYPDLGWEWAARTGLHSAASGAAASALKLRRDEAEISTAVFGEVCASHLGMRVYAGGEVLDTQGLRDERLGPLLAESVRASAGEP